MIRMIPVQKACPHGKLACQWAIARPFFSAPAIKKKALNPQFKQVQSLFHAADGNRTRTKFNPRRILSPVRLPVPPLRLKEKRILRARENLT